jgi:hypothetical protein
MLLMSRPLDRATIFAGMHTSLPLSRRERGKDLSARIIPEYRSVT